MAVKLTEMQKSVLLSFPGYEDPADTRGDLGSSWTDVADLATESGLSVKQVRGVLGTLVKRGLVYADCLDDSDKTPAQCLTEEGCDALAALIDETAPNKAEEKAAAQPMGEKDLPAEERREDTPAFADTDEEFAAQFRQAGGHKHGQKCRALREIATVWQGPRKTYVRAAKAIGLSAATACGEWKVAKAALRK